MRTLALFFLLTSLGGAQPLNFGWRQPTRATAWQLRQSERTHRASLVNVQIAADDDVPGIAVEHLAEHLFN